MGYKFKYFHTDFNYSLLEMHILLNKLINFACSIKYALFCAAYKTNEKLKYSVVKFGLRSDPGH